MLEAKFGDDLSENTISKKEKGGAINGRWWQFITLVKVYTMKIFLKKLIVFPIYRRNIDVPSI